jgi:hypothetical protein
MCTAWPSLFGVRFVEAHDPHPTVGQQKGRHYGGLTVRPAHPGTALSNPAHHSAIAALTATVFCRFFIAPGRAVYQELALSARGQSRLHKAPVAPDRGSCSVQKLITAAVMSQRGVFVLRS